MGRVASAQLDKARTDLLDGRPVVLAEIRDCLVVRRQPTKQPHDLDVAAGFAFQSAARLHAVEIAVNVQFQIDRRMIRRPTGCRRIDAVKPKIAKIQGVHEDVDHANRIALVNPVIEAFRRQRQLRSIHPRYEARHPCPRRINAES
jgi:hypothetical protein